MAGNEIIGVDLGGTNLRVGLVRNKKTVEYIKKKTPKEKNELIKELFDCIEILISKNVRAIGVGCAGPLKNGIIVNPPNLPLKNFNLKKVIKNKFKIKVVVENDAACVALAEARLGCKKKNFIILTLGTGIGGGIIINGKLYRGCGYGGEFGHIVIDNGEYFENLGAWKKTKELTKNSFGKELTVKELLKIDNKKSRKILDIMSRYLGQGIGSLINVFDPEIVILSGGMKDSGSKFLNMIKKNAKKYVLIPNDCKIKWTGLKHPGILGAGLLVE